MKEFSPKSILRDAMTELDQYVENVSDQIERANVAIKEAERKREVIKKMLIDYQEK